MLLILMILVLLSSFDIIITGITLGINNIILKKRYILYINIFILILLVITFYIKRLIINLVDISSLKYIIFLLLLYLGIKKLYIYIKNRKKDSSIPIINQLNIHEIILLIISLSLDTVLIVITNNLVYDNFIFFLVSHFIIENLFLYISNYYSYKFIKLNQNTNNLVSSILFIVLFLLTCFN